eukprot:7658489-Pyramimonas_sp.AAC.2
MWALWAIDSAEQELTWQETREEEGSIQGRTEEAVNIRGIFEVFNSDGWELIHSRVVTENCCRSRIETASWPHLHLA